MHKNVTIKLFVPKSYSELSDRQARWLFRAMLRHPDMNSGEFKTIVFVRFSGIKVITRFLDTSDWLIKAGKTIFRIDPQTLAVATRHLDWILFPPAHPWRPRKIAGRRPADPRLYDLRFADWLSIENLYQGYIQTENPELLRDITRLLIPRLHLRIRNWELQAVFRWIASVKDFYSKRFPNFYSAAPEDGALGNSRFSARQLEDSMNAQIRALTKGDVTKEREILEMPTLRALVELDAQAREYQEFKSKTKSK